LLTSWSRRLPNPIEGAGSQIAPIGQCHARVDQAISDVIEGGVAAQQVVALEHEPDMPATKHRKLAVRQMGHAVPGHHHVTRRGTIEGPMMWSSVDLPLPEGPTTATSSPEVT
jgi:hypothetical protein